MLAQRFFNARNSSGEIVEVQLLNLIKLNLNKIKKEKANKQTLIDVVLTTNENIVNACEVMSSAISDHSLVCVTLKMKAPGLDKVTARVLKDSLPTTLSAITG